MLDADTEDALLYTLSLHDALPIWAGGDGGGDRVRRAAGISCRGPAGYARGPRTDVPGGDRDLDPVVRRSEEHTSELQSRQYLVCRLLLEKKNSGGQAQRVCIARAL